MATPNAHALLSASGAHRWLICTASPRYEAGFPDKGSEYAAEGTLAHSFAEAFAKLYAGGSALAQNDIEALKKNLRYDPEMLSTGRVYGEYLAGVMLGYKTQPHLTLEQRVDMGEWIPDGFGTCDSIIIGDDHLHITDYKHGKGVEISAEGNPQMRLYALGALKRYRPIYGDRIKRVTMAIVQPRLHAEPSEDEMTVDELLAWGEEIKPIARKAFDGKGDFVPGEHCRFCRGKAQCSARARYYAGFEEASRLPIYGRLSEDAQGEALATYEPVLRNEDVGKLLKLAEGLAAWYEDLKGYAQSELLLGHPIPGWKLVEGRSIREFTDADAAAAALIDSGVDEALLYERRLLTLSAMEKLVGKKSFATYCGQYVVKPPGKPTIVAESDKRPAYNKGAAEFGGGETK